MSKEEKNTKARPPVNPETLIPNTLVLQAAISQCTSLPKVRLVARESFEGSSKN